MDRRVIFVLVFFITLFSTLVVAAVALYTGQSVLRTVLLSLATMWITGILSQILLLNLYQGIVKPLENERLETQRQRRQEDLNLQDIEKIEDATQLLREANKAESSQRARERAQVDV